MFEDTPDVHQTLPEGTALDPTLLDPEMTTYFFGLPSHNPPPYSEDEPHVEPHVDTHEEFSEQMPVHHSGSSWMSHYDNRFETYIAQPLSDPILHPDLACPYQGGLYPTTTLDDRSMSISPSLLNKSASISVQDEVVWYSNGKEMQVGGKKPPRTKYGGEGKGKGKVMEKRRKTIDNSPRHHVDDTPSQNGKGRRYEVNVETRLDTIKRIKLVFHDRSTDAYRPSSPGSLCGGIDPVDTDSTSLRKSETQDMIRPDVLRVTPLAAIEPGCLLPNARDIFLDENTPPPIVSNEKLPKFEVIIPVREIDKNLYPVFLGKDAKQTMVRSKFDGTIKGLIFSW